MSLATYITYPGYTLKIKFPPEDFAHAWVVNPTNLSHEKNIKNSIDKTMSSLEVGAYYKVTYEVFNYVNCSVQLFVGNTQSGQVASANGFYTDYFLISGDIDKHFKFISDGILKIRGIKFEKKEITTIPVPFDGDQFENHSWTLSYSFHSSSWISWHSYLPSYYIYNQNSFYSYNSGINALWKHNKEGNFQTFYDKYNPFIVEYVPTSTLQDKTLEDITLQIKARRYDNLTKNYLDERFIMFNKIVAYNSRQCTGELIIKIKDDQPNPENWLQQQITDEAGIILATRKERNWNLDDFRDYITDYTKPMFTTAWQAIKLDYYIDKVVNNDIINFEKSWEELESFRDKFIVIRLKFDSFDNINLIFNYSLDTELNSDR